MRFFLRFFIVVAVLTAIFFGIFWLKVKGPGAADRLENSLQATALDKNKQNSGPAQPTPEPKLDTRLAVQQAAVSAGVTLGTFSDYGTHQDVVVEWRGDSNQRGGEFLTILLNKGILANFEESAPPQASKNRRGENIWRVQYRLYMK